jgi:hypothetical protein
MVYYHGYGIVKQKLTLAGLLVIAGLFAFLATLTVFSNANAASQPVNYTNVPFTNSELTNWVTDRKAPSGGSSSLTTFSGRSDVLQMNIVAAAQDPNAFYQTEGLQRSLNDVVAVKADLFVDSSWLSTKVRAGLWGVGHDTSEAVSAYPILEFTTDGSDSFIGWRIWDGVLGGWTNLPGVNYNVNGWNKLEVVFNSATSQFDFYVNGSLVGSNTGTDTEDLGAVILNSKNYGTLGADYSVRWSNFGYGNLWANPTSKDQCKGGGWSGFGFKNQGLCIQYVNTGKDSRVN